MVIEIPDHIGKIGQTIVPSTAPHDSKSERQIGSGVASRDRALSNRCYPLKGGRGVGAGASVMPE